MSNRKPSVAAQRVELLEAIANAGPDADWQSLARRLAALSPQPKSTGQYPAARAAWDDYAAPSAKAPGFEWRLIRVEFEGGKWVYVETACIKTRPINWGRAMRDARSKLMWQECARLLPVRLVERVNDRPGPHKGQTYQAWDHVGNARERHELAQTLTLPAVVRLSDVASGVWVTPPAEAPAPRVIHDDAGRTWQQVTPGAWSVAGEPERIAA